MRIINKVSIKSKLITILLFVSICAMLATGYICQKIGHDNLTDKVFSQLISIRAAKSQQIETYFEKLVQRTQTLSEDLMFVAAMKEFEAAFRQLEKAEITPNIKEKIDTYYRKEILPKLAKTVEGTPLIEAYKPTKPVTEYLQYHYAANNPNPTGKKDLLDNAGDGSDYSKVHAIYHPLFRNIAKRFGFYDLYLIDTTGNIVYMLSKEIDFGSNILNGRFSESNLGAAVADCLKAKSTEYVKIVDFQPYQPSYNAPASFVASPIFENDKMVGILAFQLPIDEVNRIMTNNQKWKENDLGDTGESFLVGSDRFMRSGSRFLIEKPEEFLQSLRDVGVDELTINQVKNFNTTILLQEVKTEAVKRALAGEEGAIINTDYRGTPALISYAPLKLDGLKWAIVTKMDIAEAFTPVDRFNEIVFISMATIILVLTIVAMRLADTFVQPIQTLVASLRRVITRESDTVVKMKSQDEFRDLANAFNKMLGTLQEQTELGDRKDRENQQLLLSVLPEQVVKRLQRGEKDIADNVSNAAILFADLHGFTEISQSTAAKEVLAILNDVVGAFDDMAIKYGVEKIKTFGDGYMAACGLSVARVDAEKRAVDFGAAMLGVVHRFNNEKGWDLDLQIGIHTGDVITGLVGRKKFTYDVWGETVAVSYKLKSVCPPGGILVSQKVRDRLADLYDFALFGELEAKKQKLAVWQYKGILQQVISKGKEVDE